MEALTFRGKIRSQASCYNLLHNPKSFAQADGNSGERGSGSVRAVGGTDQWERVKVAWANQLSAITRSENLQFQGDAKKPHRDRLQD